MGHSTEDEQTHTAAAWMSCWLHASRSLTRRVHGYQRRENPRPRLFSFLSSFFFFLHDAILPEHDLARLLPTTCCRGSRVIMICAHRRRTMTHTRRMRPSKLFHHFCFVLLVSLPNHVCSLRSWETKWINMNKTPPTSNILVLSQWQ